MNNPQPPMDVAVDTIITLDQRVLGGWNHEKVERLREILAYRYKASETIWYPMNLTIRFEAMIPREARIRVTNALKDMI